MIHRNEYLEEIGAKYHPLNQTLELPDGQLVSEEEFRRWDGQDLKNIKSDSLIEFLLSKEKKIEKTADLI